MKKTGFLLLIGMTILALLTGCEDKKSLNAAKSDGHPDLHAAAMSPRLKGKVQQVLDAGSFTYVDIQSDEGRVWVAAPRFQVQTGAEVIVPEGRLMVDFYSKRLDRTFNKVFFVAGVLTENDVAGSAQDIAMPASSKMPSMPDMSMSVSSSSEASIDCSGIEKIAGGQTISKLYAEKQNFQSKPVMLRARVVKLRPNIMGKNWFHVRDGSGSEKDLTVTSQDLVEVGDLVVVSGILATDKDYGLGRIYELVVEDGKIAREN